MELNEKGITIVEALMAVVILSICVIGAMKLNTSNFFSARKLLSLSRQVMVAKNLMENLASVDYDKIDDECSSDTVTIDNDRFYINCNVVSYASTFKFIIVSVTSSTGNYYNLVFYRLNK